MIDWTTAARADGSKLIDWLDRRGLLDDSVIFDAAQVNAYCKSETWISEAVLRARRNGNFTFEFADRMLIRLGLHPSQVPNEIWLGEGSNPGRRTTCISCGIAVGECNPDCEPCRRRSTARRRRKAVKAPC